jgi:hypothetical protein
MVGVATQPGEPSLTLKRNGQAAKTLQQQDSKVRSVQ